MTKVLKAEIQYLAPLNGPAVHQIYPRSSGLSTKRPANEAIMMTVTDARATMRAYSLDEHGFTFYQHHTSFNEFYTNPAAIRSEYYAQCTQLVMEATDASHVIAFDHNLRSKAHADAGVSNMNEPVRFCHNDYTDDSGPKRVRDLMPEIADEPLTHRFAFVNVWRPLIAPVRDKPLALCVASSIDPDDLIPTEIQHYKDENLAEPAHRGEIYSVRHNPNHQWVYMSDMNLDEVILIKCFDSATDGRARFTPHTAIDLPDLTADTPQRESIEVRTVAFFD